MLANGTCLQQPDLQRNKTKKPHPNSTLITHDHIKQHQSQQQQQKPISLCFIKFHFFCVFHTLFKFISIYPRNKKIIFSNNTIADILNWLRGNKENKKKNVPALQEVGGSFCKSFSSLRIRLEAMDGTSEFQIWMKKRDQNGTLKIKMKREKKKREISNG